MRPETFRGRRLAWLVLVPFATYSTWVTYDQGFSAFFTQPWTHPTWTQEFLDLLIALALVSVWLHGDARRRGRSPWPWLLATPLLGSLAPLTYLALRPDDPPPAAEAP